MTGEAFLADTHILLWSLDGDPRLSASQLAILGSDAAIFVSIASVWEIFIKMSIGKLRPIEDLPKTLTNAGYTILPIEFRHAEAVRHLPNHHRDPFDRMLIAQAQIEGLTILTTDRRFAAYGVALA